MARIETFAGITTGSTTIGTTAESVNHTFQLKATNPSTLVVYAEGSVDGETFGALSPDSGAVTGMSVSGEKFTISTAGTYIISVSNTPLSAVKLTSPDIG